MPEYQANATILQDQGEGRTTDEIIEQFIADREKASEKLRHLRAQLDSALEQLDDVENRYAELQSRDAVIPDNLRKALDLVHGDRQGDYGHPLDNHGATADAWNAYIGQRFLRCSRMGLPPRLDAIDVCELHKLEKSIRFAWNRKADCGIDTYGYQLNEDMIDEERERRMLAALEQRHGGE